jgi:hypothetical protein
VAFGLDAYPVEQREPQVAEGRVFRQDNVLAQVNACAASGNEGGTVFQGMDGAQVAAVRNAGVI